MAEDNIFEIVKQKLNIVDVISLYISLTKKERIMWLVALFTVRKLLLLLCHKKNKYLNVLVALKAEI